MDQEQSNSPMKLDKQIAYRIVACIVVFAVAFSLGAFTGPKVFSVKDPFNARVENTYDSGWGAAKKRLAESDFARMVNIQDVRSVQGSIESIQGERISIRIRPLEPLADPVLDSRVVVVNGATKVLRLEPKNPQLFQKEMEEFFEKLKKNKVYTDSISPPESFIKTDISVGDLKVGDRIIVLSGENIKVAREFLATEIRIEATRAVSMAFPSR